MSGADAVVGVIALGALLLPGWIAARSARVPQPLLAAFIGGAVALLGVVLALEGLGLRLTVFNGGIAWLALTAITAVIFRRNLFHSPPAVAAPRFVWRDHWPLLIPLVPAFAVVIYRATTQPLFGIDTIFRWNYLAEQMLARGTLDFYPPVTAAHYEVYAWPDGIAPVVSALYFWIYALAGTARPALTAPLVVAQFCLLVLVVHAFARRLFSDRAAAFAVALLACSPVIAWSTAMGQETGLTALALIALLFYLPQNRSEETTAAVVCAGLAAALGALAREYGLALPALGLALAVARRLSPRALLTFAGIVAVGVGPWYARNWIRTGNPLFNLDLGGWFPTNQAHVWLNESYQAEFGWSHLPPGATRFVLVNCLAALLGGAAGALLYFRRARALLLGIGLIGGLWIASVGYTAAGFTATLRVLNPALVLAAVLGGAAVARWIPARQNLGAISLALGIFAVDAALRALTLPGTVYKIPAADWFAAGGAVQEYHARPIYGEIARVAGRERLLVLGPNALLTRQGARTVPLWSPEVRFIFDDTLPATAVAHRLRAATIGFVLLNKGPANERYLARSAFFRAPGNTLRPLWADDEMILYQVVAP